MKVKPEDSESKKLLSEIEMIFHMLSKVMEANGIQKIPCKIGEKYNKNVHEIK